MRFKLHNLARKGFIALAASACVVASGQVTQTQPIPPNIQQSTMPPAVTLPAPPAPVEQATRQISAEDAARIALRTQQSLQVAAASVLTASGRAAEARAALNPTLTATGSYSRSETFRPASGASSSSGSTGTQGFASGVTIKQLIFDFNHTLDTLRQASSQEAAAKHDYSKAQSDLILSVKTAFYNFVQSTNLVAVSEANLANRNSQLALARARFDAGIGQPADVVQAETNLGDAQQALVQARATETNSRVSLAVAMGIDPRTPISATASHEAPEVTLDVNSLVTSALEKRPEILSAKESARAATFGLSAARTLTAPSLSLSLNANSRGVRDPLDSSSGTASIGLNWPIFDGGIQSGRITEARAGVQSANASLILAQQQVASDVAQAYVSLKSAEQRKTITAAQVVNALEGVRIAQGRYQAGLGLFVDVTTAQALLVTAQTNDVNAQASIDTARASLARATGQPFTTSANR